MGEKKEIFTKGLQSLSLKQLQEIKDKNQIDIPQIGENIKLIEQVINNVTKAKLDNWNEIKKLKSLREINILIQICINHTLNERLGDLVNAIKNSEQFDLEKIRNEIELIREIINSVTNAKLDNW